MCHTDDEAGICTHAGSDPRGSAAACYRHVLGPHLPCPLLFGFLLGASGFFGTDDNPTHRLLRDATQLRYTYFSAPDCFRCKGSPSQSASLKNRREHGVSQWLVLLDSPSHLLSEAYLVPLTNSIQTCPTTMCLKRDVIDCLDLDGQTLQLVL